MSNSALIINDLQKYYENDISGNLINNITKLIKFVRNIKMKAFWINSNNTFNNNIYQELINKKDYMINKDTECCFTQTDMHYKLKNKINKLFFAGIYTKTFYSSFKKANEIGLETTIVNDCSFFENNERISELSNIIDFDQFTPLKI
jgi:nicotinamidase-related amidase